MTEQDKNKIDNIVKSKIKGLGLDALFHQVDITQKNDDLKTPENSQDDIALIRKISSCSPQLLQNKTFRSITGFWNNFNAKKGCYRVIIDIGTNSIKLLIAKYDKTALILDDAKFIPIPQIITNSDEKLHDFIRKSIMPLAQSPLFKKAKICSLISGNAAFVKFIRLPAIEKQDLEKVLYSEAENHFPLSLSEIEMDYHIISQDKLESKLIVIAIKKDIINEHLMLLKSFNINPDCINISSIALYNSSFNRLKNTGIYLQVHIGAAHTDINIISNKELRFCRNIAWGSKDLTLRLSKNLNLSFDNSQKLKHENGIIITKKEANETQRNISSISEKWADDLIIEIKRTLEAFQLNSGKTNIQQLSLSGGGSCLINLNEYLREKLKIKTVLEKPIFLEGKPSAASDYEKHYQEFHLCTGLINKPSLPQDISIDLMPQNIKHKIKAEKLRSVRRKYAAVALSLGLLLIWPLMIFLSQQRNLFFLDRQIKNLDNELKTAVQLREQLLSINNYLDPKSQCLEVLREISILTPYDITITDFSFKRNDFLDISGIAQTHGSALNFALMLNGSSLLDSAKVSSIDKNDALQTKGFVFRINCKIKNSRGD